MVLSPILFFLLGFYGFRDPIDFNQIAAEKEAEENPVVHEP